MNTSVASYTVSKTDVSGLLKNISWALTLFSSYVSKVIYVSVQLLQVKFCVHPDISHTCLMPRSFYFPILIHPETVIYENYCPSLGKCPLI
jgi:hypothetical protein